MTYQAEFELGAVALNVKDLKLVTAFYEEVLGMTVLESSSSHTFLGTQDRVLVELYQSQDQSEVKTSYGLYHFALLLPDRVALGRLFRHFLKNEIPLQGASDHGYSEAIYLEDPEGNGIEVYRDRPMSEWDIREDGQIVGITIELDALGLYESATDTDEKYQLANATTMGHIHLSVPDNKSSAQLYQEVLNLGEKFAISRGSWLASGTYHHHLAMNEWAGKGLNRRQEGQNGLAYYTVVYASPLDYQTAIKRAEKAGLHLNMGMGHVLVTDTDGITTKLTLV